MFAVFAGLALSWTATFAAVSMPAFDADHRGRTAGEIAASAAHSDTHGWVVHDGLCAYAVTGKLGCFDPTSTGDDLSCGSPVIMPAGVVWLYLHHALYVPFTGEPRKMDFPLWAYAQAPDRTASGDGALLVWGMGDGSAQELWRWDLVSGESVKVLTGPAEMSGGVSPWPGSAECLALTSYKPAAGVCDGESTIWKWCAATPTALAPVKRFPGCSGSIAAATDAVWVLGGSRAVVRDWASDRTTTYAYGAELLTLAPDTHGVVHAFRFDGTTLTVGAP